MLCTQKKITKSHIYAVGTVFTHICGDQNLHFFGIVGTLGETLTLWGL